MRILLIAHLSPPSPMSAARRVGGLTRHWAQQGHEVTVLTSVLAGSGPVPGAARTVRARDLMATGLNWRADNFAALSGGAEGGQATYAAAPSPIASIPVPDVQAISWAPFALARAFGLLRASRFDAMVTTSPPPSAHLVGRALAGRGVPWVADFRDGWRFERSAGDFPLAAQRVLDNALERSVARRADLVVGVSEPITADLETRHGITGQTITNGFDPADTVAAAGDWEPPLRDDRHSLVYTGSLSFGGRSLAPLLTALEARRARGDTPEVELVVAGPLSPDEQAQLEEHAEVARSVGNLELPRALALQRAADSLLLVAGERHTSIATGKLYEYFAARRPILVLGERSAAARLVEQAGAGAVANAENPESIEAALATLTAGEAGDVADEAVERYSYTAIARRYAEALARLRPPAA